MHRRPFQILGVQQIAIGALDPVAMHRLWIDLLGLSVVGAFESKAENVREEIAVVGEGAAQIQIDLMQPIDPEGKPRVHEPALNHIGLWVDDLHAAVRWLQEQGLRFAPGGIRKGAGGKEVAFIHPRASKEHPLSGEGVLIELVQAPEELIDEMAHQRRRDREEE